MAHYRFSVDTTHGDVAGTATMQGVCVDPAGGRFWTSNSTELFLYTEAAGVWTFSTSRNVTADDPTTKSQVNSITYDPVANKLYVGANNFNAGTKLGWIVEYDPDDLTHIATHSVEAHYAEGCAARYEGSDLEFWVHYHDWPQVTRYDDTWTKISDYALPGCSIFSDNLFQGGFWVGDDLYMVRHNNNDPAMYYVFRWSGSAFTLVEAREAPISSSLQCGQGLSFDFANLKAYWAQRDSGQGNVVETTMSLYSPTSLGNGWTLLHSGKMQHSTASPSIALDTTGADLIFIEACVASGTPTLTDSRSNTINALTSVTTTSNRKLYRWYITPSSVGVGHTFTAGSASFASMYAAAFSGAEASPLDQQSTANTTTQAGSITPSENGELIIASLCSRTDTTYTIDSGFTIAEATPYLASNYDGGALAYLVQSTAAAVNPAWNVSETVAIVSFKGVGAGGTEYTITPSGGVSFSGSTPLLKGRVFITAGGVTFAGEATYETHTASRIITPSGGLVLSGTADVIFDGNGDFVITPSGGVVFGGSSPLIRGKILTSEGTITFSGTAGLVTHTASRVITPSGGVVFSGTANVRYTAFGVEIARSKGMMMMQLGYMKHRRYRKPDTKGYL
jgi:hypothetical protein